jgi:tetratricopeptide (TPR) repeat protein
LFNESSDLPGFSSNEEINESVQPTESFTAQKTNALPLKLILGVVGGITLLLLIISGLSVGGNSVEKKLDKAIAAGSIFGPSNENAHDLYFQLINSGANEETLKRYREKLTPLLTQHGYRLTTDLLIFGYDEPDATEWQEAGRSLDWAVELNPGNSYMSARAAYCNGRAAFVQKQFDQALAVWTKAANWDKSWALPVNGIGLIYYGKRDYSNARSYFSDAINREPNWAVPYENMGNAYYMEKNRDRARGFYNTAAGKAPDWAKPHVHLADMAVEDKDYSTAVSEFEKALSSNAKGLKSQETTKVQQRLEIARQRLSG